MSHSVEQPQAPEPANDDAKRRAAARSRSETKRPATPSDSQRKWLTRGLDQAGGKLPLFDGMGQKISERTVRSCIDHGWAEPWFSNPLKPDWLVCKLTEAGRKAISS